MITVGYYNWGEFEYTEEIDESQLKEMIPLDNELNGFSIREEDETKTFFAHEDDIDSCSLGTSVKHAYAVKQEDLI